MGSKYIFEKRCIFGKKSNKIICNFDPFATGSPYYEFENVCLKHNLH